MCPSARPDRYEICYAVSQPLTLIGERERSLPSRPNGAIFLYIYLFIYIFISGVDVCRNVLRNCKLHFPLAKNVMHSSSLELRRTLRHTSTPDIYIYRKIVPVVRLG